MQKFLFLLVITLATFPLMAQEPEKQVDYQILFEFSGEVTESLDSLYQVNLVVDENELIKLQRFYIKMGSDLGLSDLFALAFDDTMLAKKKYDKNDEKEKLLKKDGTKIKIALGVYPFGDYYIEVNSKDKDGKYIKSNENKE